jgi:hypothetical protein
MARYRDEGSEELSSGAALAFTALVGELPSLLVLLVMVAGSGSALASSATATAIDAQPGLNVACWIVVTVVPLMLLAIAAWRRYWAAAAIQASVLLAASIMACVRL